MIWSLNHFKANFIKWCKISGGDLSRGNMSGKVNGPTRMANVTCVSCTRLVPAQVKVLDSKPTKLRVGVILGQRCQRCQGLLDSANVDEILPEVVIN